MLALNWKDDSTTPSFSPQWSITHIIIWMNEKDCYYDSWNGHDFNELHTSPRAVTVTIMPICFMISSERKAWKITNIQTKIFFQIMLFLKSMLVGCNGSLMLKRDTFSTCSDIPWNQCSKQRWNAVPEVLTSFPRTEISDQLHCVKCPGRFVIAKIDN